MPAILFGVRFSVLLEFKAHRKCMREDPKVWANIKLLHLLCIKRAHAWWWCNIWTQFYALAKIWLKNMQIFWEFRYVFHCGYQHKPTCTIVQSNQKNLDYFLLAKSHSNICINMNAFCIPIVTLPAFCVARIINLHRCKHISILRLFKFTCIAIASMSIANISGEQLIELCTFDRDPLDK